MYFPTKCKILYFFPPEILEFERDLGAMTAIKVAHCKVINSV